MRQLLIVLFAIILFTACNSSSGGGWSSQDREKGLKACMDQVEGKLDEASSKKFCNCALEGAMKKWKSYAESEKAPDDDPAGVEIGKNCMAAIQAGNDPENPKKPGGLLGGTGWSKADKNTFQSQCENSLAGQGYDQSQAQKLCSCVIGKLEKKYSSLNEANEKGGEAAGATAIQECAGGGGGGDDDNN